MKRLSCVLSAIACATMCAGAPAQSFPTKPVRIIVAFPPGGGVDIVARIVRPRLAEIWAQQVIVENRAGASGVIGTEAAARSAPDGHTVLLATMGNLTVNQYLYPRMPVDAMRDLAPLMQVVAVHFVMVAHPSLPAKNVKELITLARSGVPGYELTNWFGLVVPAATPGDLVTRLYGDFSRVLQQPEVRERLVGMGADVVGSTPEQFGTFMRAETVKWAKVIKEANIRAE